MNVEVAIFVNYFKHFCISCPALIVVVCVIILFLQLFDNKTSVVAF